MQDVLIEKPYAFVPAIQLEWPQRLLIRCRVFERILRRDYGVIRHECRNVELLRQRPRQVVRTTGWKPVAWEAPEFIWRRVTFLPAVAHNHARTRRGRKGYALVSQLRPPAAGT